MTLLDKVYNIKMLVLTRKFITDYYWQPILYLLIFLSIIISFFSFYDYQQIKNNNKKNLKLVTGNIHRDISDIFARINNINNYIGKDIAKLKSDQNFNNNVSKILKNYHDRPGYILPWPGVGWMDINGYQTVTYKIGVRDKKINMNARKYIPHLSRDPWKLHNSTPSYGSNSKKWIIPVATGIVNRDKKYIGAVIVAIDINKLLTELQKNIPQDVKFLITDNDHNMIINNYDDRQIIRKININRNKAINNNDYYQIIDNIKYSNFQTLDQYNYFISTGYSQNYLQNQIKNLILDKLSEISIITIFFAFILVLLRIKNNIREQEKITLMAESLAASIAHEMRNPLNLIRLASNNLPNNNENLLSNELKLFKQQINKTIDLASNIIDMNLQELAGKKLSKEDFSYHKSYIVIIDAITIYGYKNNEEKDRLLLDLGFKIVTAKDIENSNFAVNHHINRKNNFILHIENTAFKYVIFNIVKNALFYLSNFPESKVIISCHKNKIIPKNLIKRFNINPDKKDIKYNAIEIIDTGPGIKEEIISNIFEPYFTSGKNEGTGVGLSFCKRMMKNFGGEIICESKFGEWTKFSLLFPILDKVEEKSAIKEIKRLESSSNNLQESRNIQNQKIKNILLIDDAETNIKILSNEIKRNCPNINIEILTDPILALELIRNKEKEKKQFDLILTDIEMPKMNGVELISNIRNKLYISKYELPILAYSSRADRKIIDKVKKEGCNAYYTKTEDPIFLSRNIAKWIMYDYIPNQNIHQEDIILNNKILANYNIIIADDQSINLTLTAKKLSLHGANVTTCNDGQDIINIISRDLNKYHLIITDINMDNIGGIEAANMIRNIENKHIINNKIKSKIPIIALSGDYDHKFIMNLLNNKIDDYIVKGRDLDDLVKLSKFWIDYRMSKGRIASAVDN